MEFITERLHLRPWSLDDARQLYALASDPEVGPLCGWSPHQNIEESREVIQNFLNGPLDFCIERVFDHQIVGCISLLEKPRWHIDDGRKQFEIGFWIGRPYWGNGYVEEASRALLAYGFEQLALDLIWCGALSDNARSLRAQEKLGFHYVITVPSNDSLTANSCPSDRVSVLTNDDWNKNRDGHAG